MNRKQTAYIGGFSQFNSCPLSWWCRPTISPSVIPFSCLQSLPASGVISLRHMAKVLELQLQHQSFQWISRDDFLVWSPCSLEDSQSSLLQHHSSKASILKKKKKASILWHSAFFMVQLSYTYMTPGITIAVTRQTFVGKVMSLLFNMLSRLVIAFIPRSEHLLISRLIFIPWSDRTRCHDLSFLNVEL